MTAADAASPEGCRRKTLIALASVCALALAVRGLCLSAFLKSPLAGFFFADQMYYRNWALRIASGEWLPQGVFEQGPLYAYLLSVPFALSGPRDLPFLVAQALCGTATVALVFGVSWRLYGLKVATVAGVIAGLYGPSVFSEWQAMKTLLEPLLVVAAMYCALGPGARARRGRYAAAGALVGLACLVREIHGLLLPVVLTHGWLADTAEGRRRLARLRHLGVRTLAFLAVVAPATLANVAAGKEAVLVTAGGGEVFYMSFGPEARAYYHPPDFIRPIPRLEHADFREEASLRAGRLLSAGESSRYWFREGLLAAVGAPLRTARLLGERAVLLVNDFEVPDSESMRVARDLVWPLRALPGFGWFLGLGLVGALLVWRERPGHRLPLAFAAVLGAQPLLTFNYGRFRLAFAVVWLVLAACGAVWLFDSLRAAARAERLRGLAAVAVVALSSFVAFRTPGTVPAEWLASDFGALRQELAAAAGHRNALRPLREALASRPDDPWLLDSLGVTLENAGRGYEAVPCYLAAVRRDPSLSSSHRRLADIFFREGMLEAAVVHARAVALLEPRDPESRLALAVLASRLALADSRAPGAASLREEAEEQFDAALALDPANALVLHYRGVARVLWGMREEGIADLSLVPGARKRARMPLVW